MHGEIILRSCMAVLFLLTGFTTPKPGNITVYLVGDSTMADKRVEAYPETGWGMPFHYYFDETVTVDNHARNGRSTRTFLEEGRWKPIMNKLQKGDYVFIQFGHNDEVKSKKSYTTPENFKDNLAKFVTDTRSKGAKPVLLTPIARRRFDDRGNAVDTHKQYAELLRGIARKYQVPLIDMDAITLELLQKLGPADSRYLYNHLDPGENPHYPDGWEDNTHFNEYGARRMTELVLQGIRNKHLELANRIAPRYE